ncbi:MAG: tyrosine-type recombinase/integrase [bacterium]|nr:tyrosine-type recombinase/integrase [bacterium]
MAELPYHEKQDIENTKRLRTLIRTLPPFCVEFFRGIEPITSARTRIAYAYDLRIFFEFLQTNNPELAKKEMKDFTLDILEQIDIWDLEEYMEYLKCHNTKYKEDVVNHERGIMRKMASLKSFYNYYFRRERIHSNPAALMQMPKIREKEIIRLETDEVANLLDQVEEGDKLTKKQQDYHKKTKIRDVAMLTLMLGTGIRVSECIGLNINDLDFKNNAMKIHRKGGKEVFLYFSEEVKQALLDYLEERQKIEPAPGHEGALFLSLQKKRMSVRSVENLVKKYARIVTPLKKITPHKLRSTYGTNLYRETGDIYLVADVLGHEDVNTTKKHYAALEDSRRRSARDKVVLRKDGNK